MNHSCPLTFEGRIIKTKTPKRNRDKSSKKEVTILIERGRHSIPLCHRVIITILPLNINDKYQDCLKDHLFPLVSEEERSFLSHSSAPSSAPLTA